ncbi:hypothetical protein RRG08_034009 [Elysia crispata]|uniref:Uncharacterized protein n=1 Tax=Elysia crispata TaxID=231223 RepID=A0AAE1CKQ3_9GAST|nr:hypothetical protein RRG08_034009 [Elysia crispata]
MSSTVMAGTIYGLRTFIDGQLDDVINIDQVTVEPPLTNLVSERHFGHLHARWRRRSQSLHSYVMLLSSLIDGLYITSTGLFVGINTDLQEMFSLLLCREHDMCATTGGSIVI